ncbi:hypothetical protein KHP62_00830 [Rhodobacteraceae bacterium NNCM2]|nr:hypothetical protein [Coraliihabitans acroporae]
MDNGLRSEIADAIRAKELKAQRRTSRFRVVAKDRDHAILEMTDTGFVIEADDRPSLRGYVEIFRGDTRVDRRLVVCHWAEDGLVRYEFKCDSGGRNVRADYAPSGLAGLLSGPA